MKNFFLWFFDHKKGSFFVKNFKHIYLFTAPHDVTILHFASLLFNSYVCIILHIIFFFLYYSAFDYLIPILGNEMRFFHQKKNTTLLYLMKMEKPIWNAFKIYFILLFFFLHRKYFSFGKLWGVFIEMLSKSLDFSVY